MNRSAHQPTATDTQQPPPYLAGERVQILYMSERGTILADAHVTAVFRQPDGSFGINAVMSDSRASFHLVPATGDAATIAHHPRPRIGVDQAKAGE